MCSTLFREDALPRRASKPLQSFNIGFVVAPFSDERSTLAAQAPFEANDYLRPSSRARADAGCLVDDHELSLEIGGVRFGECEPSSS
jgi:hypothetical protein